MPPLFQLRASRCLLTLALTDTMEPEQLVYMDLASAGYYGDFLPSSEWRMHLDIYRARPAAQAILHAHPTYSTALAVQRREIPVLIRSSFLRFSIENI